MTLDTLLQWVQIIGPPMAAYVGTKIGIAEAMLTARQAKETADKAHTRIDAILSKG